MAEVHSKVSQLIAAYQKHHKCSQIEKEQTSHQLLLFYAVECGLKAQYLMNYNRQSTEDFTNLMPINNEKYGHGHDILSWVKSLNMPATIIGDFKDNNKHPLKQLHERLRYGVNMPQDDKKQVVLLKRIADALKESLNS